MKPSLIIGSDIGIKNIKAPTTGRVSYGVKGEPSLYLQVTAKRTMSWYLMAKVDGKVQRFPLGRYLVGNEANDREGTSLKSALEQARTIKDEIKAGVNHRERAAAEAQRGKDTYGAVRQRFIDVYAVNLKPSTQAGYKSSLWHKRLKAWEATPVHQITRTQVREVIHDIHSTTPVMANRTLAYLSKFFNWCAEIELIKDDEKIPTNRVKRPLRKERPRTRFLSEDEIRVLLLAVDRMDYPYGDYYKCLLFTGQRVSEVARMKWSDIDRSAMQWTQPENKADRPVIVPLNKLTLSTLENLPMFEGDYMFTTTGGEKPINGLKKTKERLDAHIQNIVKEEQLRGVFVEHWVNHDLRRTITTHLRKAKVGQDVCDKLLNHADRGVTAIHYDQYDMLDEKTEAMEKWGRILKRIQNHKAGNVLPFRKAQ
jgi:integrase